MAEPSTIDIQKVYNSATEKFKSFVGAVDSPLSSSSKTIYQNITKLFDVFTNGVLANQGANSEQVLRMVYKSMNDGFLDVLKNSEVVDSIVELMKQRQNSVNESNASTANVSDTTKKVALNQLSPDNVDLTSVMMDFAADLQTSILQTRLNLTREYERQKLAYAKSQAGQKEDLDRLNRETSAQNKEISESVSQMSEDDKAWREAQLKKMEDILAGFKSIDNTCSQDKFKEIDGIIDSNGIGSGYDPYRLMKEISAISQAIKNIKAVQTPISQKEVSLEGSPLQPSQIHGVDGEGKDVQPPIASKGHDAAEAVGQGQQTPEIPTQGTKISVSPINNKEITKIIKQESGENQTMNAPPASGLVPPGAQQPLQDNAAGKDTKISEEGVISTLNKIHGNVQATLKDQKFSSRFTLQYASIQKEIGKQMGSMDKSEEQISSDLKTTEKGIKKSRKGKGLMQMLMNLRFGFLNMVWIAIGGLILITLVRMALSKWKKTYMPPSDGSTLTIFGVKIPGWAGIKSLMVGVRNFLLVGIPNMWTKLKAFTSNAFSSLFGPKGIIRDLGRARAAIIRIAVAWITGQTKKAGGKVVKWILKIIGWAFAWVPGVLPVCNFLAKFGPHLYAYIMTQITGAAANAAAEKSARERKFVQNGDLRSRDAAEKYKQKIIAMARGVKPFSIQKANIPDLQTPKIEDNPRPGSGGAIMRRVPMKYSTNAEKVSHEVADASFEKERNANASADKARINEKGSIFSKMADAGKRIADRAAAEKGTKGTFYQQWASSPALRKKYGFDWFTASSNRNKEIQKEIMDSSVTPEIRKVDQYIVILSKSKRFQGVKGPLYHPIYGWNPGYRVYAGDLMSAIPLTPFESIHQNRDIPFGVPAGPEKDSIGFMPFTWIQDNNRISAHPLKFELERAQAIRKIYEWTAGQVTNIGRWWTGDTHFDIEDFKKKVLPKAFDMWRSWNRVMGEKIKFGYQDKNHIIFGNKFAEFINKWRQGEMDESENTMESVDNKKGYLERLKSAPTWMKVAAAVTAPIGGTMLFLLKPLAEDAIKAVSKFAVKAASNIKKTITRTISYDKSEKAKGDGTFWGNLKAGAKNAFKAAKSAARLAWWRLKSFNGVNYGNVRDFMIDGGVIGLFKGGTVANPIAKAIPLIRELVRMGVIAKDGSASHEDMPMVSLIKGYFDRVNIRGFDWRQLTGDRPALAGFAQTFLSYLAFKVLRRWNISEQLLSAFFTNATDKNKKALIAGLESLHSLFSQNVLFDFMARYLRFPNLKVHVIDYSNARGAQFWMLDKYRKAMGIPTRKERQEIRERIRRRMSRGDRKVGMLEMMLALEGKGISAFADDAKELKWLQEKIDKVAFEARHTGDKTFLIELLRYRDWLMDRIRQKQALKNGLVVQKPASVGQVPQLVPAKSKEEQEKEEQERKAKEAEEKRKKEEEDRKRLAEEAKRKQALVIAQAKIKAMEAIRNQEQKYESLLERMVQDPSKVAESELKSLGEDVANLKQEAENRIAQLPREQREMKLALIRGDKISAKTFKEMKDTAVGLHGNLQSYMEEVKKIPIGSIISVNNQSSSAQPVQMQDSDAVDLAS